VKRSTILSLLILVSMVLVALPASLGAEGPAPDYYEYGAWQYGPDTAFTWYRHDCTYFDSGDGQAYDQKVYCLGGRPGQVQESDVWMFDPVTGTWTDTGADMPVECSNYTASVLDDGTADGPGLYIATGYQVSGDVGTDAVQVYYPKTNTAVEIVSDPFPGRLGTAVPIAGGQEVVDGLLYYFGGWSDEPPAPGPYNAVETWIYDPLAAAGTRWSRIMTADLNLGRGYILSAQVDGVIYAIGGDIWDGTNLIAQTIVGAFDTANPGAGWDDAGVADMPIACDEARAVGFDSDAPYEFRGQIVTMGCGQWTDQTPDSMLYDVDADLWDASFPDLNNQRRNHGGTFVPDLGVAGSPALWVFAGLDGSPINSSEYYEVVPFAAGVRLVPKAQERSGVPGDSLGYTVAVKNQTGAADTFDLTYLDHAWPVTGPSSVGPVNDGETATFGVTVDIPPGAASPSSDTLTILAEAQGAVYTDTAWIVTSIPPYSGTLEGHIYDANTGLPLEGYVYIYDSGDAEAPEFETFADATGYYRIVDNEDGDWLLGGTYDIYGAMIGFERVDGTVTITGLMTTTLDFHLPAPIMELDPMGINQVLNEGETADVTLLISNTDGSGDLLYRIDEIAPGTGFPDGEKQGAVPATVTGVDPEVYKALAAPDDTIEILVVMAEQADLSAAYDIADWNARGHYVYNTLKATADRTQANVRKYLDGQGIAYRSHISLNSLTLQAAKSTVDALAAIPEVASVRLGYTYEVPPLTLEEGATPEDIGWNVSNVAADEVWEQFGVTGEGVVVANIDTGVEYTHDALVQQYRGTMVITEGYTFTHDYNWWDPRGACEIAGFPPDEPCDNYGHGTHTMGTIAGSDDPTNPISATNGIGVAPGAKWIACKGCEEVEGWPCSTFALLECADFMLAPWDMNMQNPDPDMRPHVVNNSWGGGANDGWYFTPMAAWRAAGIFPAFSAGNSGPNCDTVNSPSDYYNVFASGAVDQNDNIAGFSSRGPSVLGQMKPEVVAPGVSVVSSVPGNTYAPNQGTSMASPHSAGELALIWSAQPELIGQVQLTEWLMMRSADPITTTLQDCGGVPGTEVPNNTYGWGRINAFNAVSTALAYEWDVGWLEVTPDAGTVTAGDATSVNITLDATDLMPDCYTAMLKVETNDPYQGLDVFLPVELCVPCVELTSATISGPEELLAGETGTFSVTLEPPDATQPIAVTWSNGMAGTSTTYTWDEPGTHTVVVTATNCDGTAVVSDSLEVTVFQPMHYIYLPIIVKNY
jgi:subtilisin family serine protease